MMLFVVLLVVSGAIIADCADMTKYSTIPAAVTNFNVHKYSGLWYLYASTQPYTWKGANKFTDWTQNHVVKNPAKYDFYDTYRSMGSCVTIKTTANVLYDGVFLVQDTIGDTFTGKVVFADVDYDNYVFTWACVDMAFDGINCDDGWVTVKTRQPNPSAKVQAKIDAKLNALWGVTARDIGLIKQQNPCTPPEPIKPYNPPLPYNPQPTPYKTPSQTDPPVYLP